MWSNGDTDGWPARSPVAWAVKHATFGRDHGTDIPFQREVDAEN